METVTGGVAIGENEGLLSLIRCPVICEQRSVPVDLVEKMRLVLPTFWAVSVGRELHVGLVCVQPCGGIVARWEVNISTQGRSIAIAVLIWETHTSTCVAWVLDSNSIKPGRTDRVKRIGGVLTGTSPLHGLGSTIGEIKDRFASGSGWSA
jgi:hypothetical protein